MLGLGIRATLTAFVIFLSSALLLALALLAQKAWNETESARAFVVVDGVRADLLFAGAALLEERQLAYLALADAAAVGPVSTARLAAAREAVEHRLTSALTTMRVAGLDRLIATQQSLELSADRARLEATRGQVDIALERDRTARPGDLGEAWLEAATAVITTSQAMRNNLLRELPTADRDLVAHGALRQFVWIASEQASVAMAILTGAIAAGRPPSDIEHAAMSAADAQVNFAWEMVRTIAQDSMPEAVTAVVAEAQHSFFAELMPLRDQLYAAVAAGRTYPLDATEWSDRALAVIGALLAIQDVSIAWTRAQTEAQLTGARWAFVLWSIVAVLAVAACVLSLVVLHRRVLRPLTAVTSAMSRLAAGEVRTPVPRATRDDEIGAMIRALRTLKANSVCQLRLDALNQRLMRDAATAVRERELRLQAVVDSVAEGIVTFDAQGRIETANPAALRLFGYPPEDMIGRPITLLLDDAATLGTASFGVPSEMTGRAADQRPLALECTITETRIDERPVSTATLRDIGQRKEVERLKSEFVATVSHELRTPLTSIRGSLGLVLGPLRPSMPQKALSLVEIAQRNAERLIGLVNDILAVERIETGHLAFTVEPVDLVAIVDDSIEANRSFAADKGVTLGLEPGPRTLVVMADSGRIQQVLANLVSNAAKFSQSGGEVGVRIEREGGHARVTVTDNGPGVPPAFHGRIFQRFAQADGAADRQRGGTGLGLSICKAIVERHGGEIGFTSRPGLTEFHFTLPLAAALAMPEPVVRRAPSTLVCEGDSGKAHELCAIVGRVGLTADVASSVSAARDKLATGSYAALTLDLGTADPPVLALLDELRADGRPWDLPVILIPTGSRSDMSGRAVCRPTPLPRATLATILHVEDDDDLATVVANLLEGKATIVQARNLGEAVQAVRRRAFDLVILDIGLPDGSGLDLLPELRGLATVPPVMLFAAQEVDAATGTLLAAALVKSRTDDEQFVQRVLDLVEPAEGSRTRAGLA